MASLVEVKVDGNKMNALVLNDDELAVLAALTGSVAGGSSHTWREQSDRIYWASIRAVEDSESEDLYKQVLIQLAHTHIEAKEI